MLSRPGALILGIIDEREANAYEMLKLLDYINVKRWFYISESTVYATIKSLEKKGYISGKAIKEGNMPEKTLYAITETGKRELTASLEAFLGNTELDYVMFNIAVIMICHIEKARAVSILQAKLEALKEKQARQRAQLEGMKNSEPIEGVHAVKHMLLLTSSEITSTEEFLRTVEQAQSWECRLTRDICGEKL